MHGLLARRPGARYSCGDVLDLRGLAQAVTRGFRANGVPVLWMTNLCTIATGGPVTAERPNVTVIRRPAVLAETVRKQSVMLPPDIPNSISHQNLPERTNPPTD